ncbi:MAG: YeaH/YhbH family protein [Halofilum sp. (in: g-proteobacteria)]
MDSIIDRRHNPKGRSLGNRQRFVRRARSHIRRAVKENLRDRPVTDSESGENVSIPADDVHEPGFVQDTRAGEHRRVLPRNREFHEGDRIPRPSGGGGGGGSEGSEEGEGEDNFTFVLTREEFLDIFFEDLALPDMVKQRIAAETAPVPRRAGFTKDGPPNRMNLVRTMHNSMARRVALGRPGMGALNALEYELERLRNGEIQPADGQSAERRIAEIEETLERYARRRKQVPYIDPIDLRYNHFETVQRPIAQAVMFCLMDVSASMDEDMKDLAKRFFMLLHLFLKRQYERVEVVFIRHTQHAEEVDEENFFHGRQTGGTVVSSAFAETLRIVEERYPIDDWNLYLAQASDGDDAPSDIKRCTDLLTEKVLPICQYVAYVEIARDPGGRRSLPAQSELWDAYEPLTAEHHHFATRRIQRPSDIYPVFRDLFRKDSVTQ